MKKISAIRQWVLLFHCLLSKASGRWIEARFWLTSLQFCKTGKIEKIKQKSIHQNANHQGKTSWHERQTARNSFEFSLGHYVLLLFFKEENCLFYPLICSEMGLTTQNPAQLPSLITFCEFSALTICFGKVHLHRKKDFEELSLKV